MANRVEGLEEDDAGESTFYNEPEWYGVGGGAGAPPVHDEDELFSQIPLLNDLSGAKGRMEAYQDWLEAQANRGIWSDLARGAPTVDQLTPELYTEANRDEYGDLIGGRSQLEQFGPSGSQQTAMEALRSIYRQGGWTDRDEAIAAQQRRLSAMERGQQMRGANEAAMQQMQARGMGGGAMELAARLSGSQALSQGQAMGDAASNIAQQQAAQQRAMQALAGYQSGANTIQDQELARRNALDSFNNRNMDWRRDRESRNTAWMNRGGENRSNAYQRAYENRERAAAGATNQYSVDASMRNSARNREDERQKGALSFVTELFES